MDWLLQGMPSRPSGPSGLPLIKPPYSTITAINLNTGEHTWQTPVGEGIENHPRLKALNIPPTGGGGWAHPMATKTMLLGAKEGELLGLDKSTGKQFGTLNLNGMGAGEFGRASAPMTYMFNGKQYIAVPMTDTLVALALP
jgi:quinoprotein glucose dehydrogenase